MSMPVIPVKVERILVPLSLCPHSEQAFRLAHDLSQRFSSELCAIHVFADPKEKDVLYDSEIRDDGVYDKIFHQGVDELLEKMGADEQTTKSTRTIVTHGSFAEEIIREATDMHAHLIVMGTHSDKTLQQNIMGSTMTKVLKQAPCPVLTIRYPAGDPEEA